MIQYKHIHIKYKDLLLEDEFISLSPSSVTLIIGESGIGKTALLYRLSLMTLDCEVYIDNVAVHQWNQNEIFQLRRNDIGFVNQENEIIEHLSVEENIRHYALMVNKRMNGSDIKQLLNRVHLNVNLHQNVMSLSLGQRQRLAIACIMAKEPQLLIFDEPTASLDEENEMIIFSILKELAKEGKYVVFVSHSDKAKQYADQIYEINHKKIKCIKDNVHSDMQRFVFKRDKLKMNFYINYIKNYLKKYIFQYSLLVFIISLMFILNGYMFENKIQTFHKQVDLLYEQYEKILFVTGSQSSIYQDNANQLIDLSEHQSYEYPFIQMKIDGYSKIDIIPYFDKAQFEQKIDKDIDHFHHGLYLSQSVYQDFNYSGFLGKSLSLNLNVYVYNDETGLDIKNYQSTFKISGILKEGIVNHYNRGNKDFIYVYYDDLKKIYDQFPHNQYYIGMTSMIDDIDKIETLSHDYKEKGYGVNEDFINKDVIDELSYHFEKTYQQQLIIMNVIFFIIVMLINIYLNYKRRKEFSLLMMNGISYKYIVNIEYAFIFILSILISLIYQCLFPLSFYYNGILASCIYMILSVVLLNIYYYFHQRHCSIENMFRN